MIRVAGRALVGLVLSLSWAMAWSAEGPCYEYRAFYTSSAVSEWVTSPEAACQAMAGLLNEANSGQFEYVLSWSSGTTCTGTSQALTGQACAPGGPYTCPGSPQPYTADIQRREGECPPDACAAKAGQDAFVGMNAGGGTGSYCSGGCKVDVPAPTLRVSCSADGNCSSKSIYQSTFTGQSCGAEPAVDEGNCTVGPFGRMCASAPTGKSCGTYNGDRVCVESIPSGCQSYASGAVACVVEGEGATTAVPDSGTEGVPATPTMQVAKNGRTVNYYNSATVNSSTTITTGSSAGSGTGSSGDGLGDGDDIDPCEGEGCTGEFPSLGACDDDLTACVGSAFSAGWSAVEEASPLIGVASGLGAALAAPGTCPAAPVTMFDHDYDLMEAACDILDEKMTLIALVCLVGWSLVGVRILLDT